jgi:outer membrane protein assembly factor BamB
MLAVGVLLVSGCDWTDLRYAPSGTGFNPFETVINASNVSKVQRRWTESSPFLESSPVVANGDLFVSAGDGRVVAFDATSGTLKWSFSTGSGNVIDIGGGLGLWVPAPAVASGVVYDMAGNGTLFAIDATTGSKLWSTRNAGAASASLVVANGVVYVSDSQVSAFAASSGALMWRSGSPLPGGGALASFTVPAVANGVVYTTTTTFGGVLTDELNAYNATTGALLWGAQPTFNAAAPASPAVANGVVYLSDTGKLSAFNATTGASLWSAPAGTCCFSPVPSSPAVANGVVYDNANDGTLLAFNATTGALKWSTAKGTTAIGSSPVVADGIVYVDGADGHLDAFNATSGVELWSLPTAGSPALPIVANGVLYATSHDPSSHVGDLDAYSLPFTAAGLTVSSPIAPDYGTVLDGTTSPTTTFTVSDFGTAATSAISASLTGADPSQFRITSDTCSGTTLPGRSSCTIAVAFAPTLKGVRTATLAVHAATGGSTVATLSGKGKALTLDPSAQDFGTVLDGSSSAPTIFTVTNHSAIAVSLTVASLAGSQFTATSNTCGASLAAGAACTIGAAFTPTGVGPVTTTGFGPIGATLSVNTVGETANAGLSGTAQPVTIAPTSEDYGTIAVGSSSAATFTITNVSSAALPTPFAPSTATGSGFTVTSDGCNGVTLASGASCTVVVTFGPTATGTTAGQLTVSLDFGYFEFGYEATLTGTGG